MGAGVQLIDLLAKLGSPLRHCHSEINIQTQSAQSDDGVPLVKLYTQDTQHQQHLDQGRHDAVERIGNQRLNAAHTSFNVTAHTTGLTLEVKTQTQFVQMLEGLQGNGASSTLCGFGKNQFTQLGECRNR